MRIILFFLCILSTVFTAPKVEERETLLSIVSGEWVAQSLYAATKLDIASHLMQGTKHVSDLARLTDTHEESLYRTLRLLASHGVFEESGDRFFSNSKKSLLLARQHPDSLRSLILFYGDEMSESVRFLPETIKEGKPGFEIAYQQPVFTYFRQHPNSGKLFNIAMQEKSKMVISSCLSAFDFGKFKSIYDIGGGKGHFLSAILNRYAHLRGLLFDTQEVISAAENEMKMFGKRCALISGDFFQQVPVDGDAYLLKSVIHDWDDAKAVQVLKKCRSAMGPGAKLLIVEPLITAANHKEYAKSMDLLMMTVTGGRERTEEDFRSLLHEAGFRLESVTPTRTEFSILQASKK